MNELAAAKFPMNMTEKYNFKLIHGRLFKFKCCSHFLISGPFNTRENKKLNKVNLIGTISQNT